MPLYNIEPEGRSTVHVVARNIDHAAEVFITWDVAHGRSAVSFTIGRQRIDAFTQKERAQLRSAFALKITAIAKRDGEAGLAFDLLE